MNYKHHLENLNELPVYNSDIKDIHSYPEPPSYYEPATQSGSSNEPSSPVNLFNHSNYESCWRKNVKPTYAYMIAMALNSHPKQMMKLTEIYQYIENNYINLISKSKIGWKNSIRHNLSLNKLFVNIKSNKIQQDGIAKKGGYWTFKYKEFCPCYLETSPIKKYRSSSHIKPPYTTDFIKEYTHQNNFSCNHLGCSCFTNKYYNNQVQPQFNSVPLFESQDQPKIPTYIPNNYVYQESPYYNAYERYESINNNRYFQ